MKFDAGTRTRILVDVTAEIDPTDSTVEVRVDDTWHPATWLDEPVESRSAANARTTWKQTARTDTYFAGPDAAAGGATVLALGRYPMEVRVTSGQDILTRDLERLEVS